MQASCVDLTIDTGGHPLRTALTKLKHGRKNAWTLKERHAMMKFFLSLVVLADKRGILPHSIVAEELERKCRGAGVRYMWEKFPKGSKPGRLQVKPNRSFAQYGNRAGLTKYQWLRQKGGSTFKRHCRMSVGAFDELRRRLDPHLRPRPRASHTRSLCVGETMAIALMNLGTRSEAWVVGSVFGRPASTVQKFCTHRFIQAVRAVLWIPHTYGKSEDDEFHNYPRDQEIDDIALSIENDRGLPGCIGAVDGKHFPIVDHFRKTKSDYRNFKGWSSLTALAWADHKYRFRWVSEFFPGGTADARIWRGSRLRAALESDDDTDWPIGNTYRKIVVDGEEISPYLCGDYGMSNSWRILKAYSRKKDETDARKCVLNDQQARGGRYIEQSWGVLTNRFRSLTVRNEWGDGFGLPWEIRVRNGVQACMAVHNFLVDYGEPELDDTEEFPYPKLAPVAEIAKERRVRHVMPKNTASSLRERLADFFFRKYIRYAARLAPDVG